MTEIPIDAEKLRAKAYALFKKRQFQPAALTLQKAMNSVGGGGPEDYVFLGIILTSGRFYPSAIKIFKEAARKWPDLPEFDHNVGRVYGRMGQPEKAVKWLEKALEKDPKEQKFHNGLALQYGFLENWEKVKFHGEKTLDCRDRAICKKIKVEKPDPGPPPPFNPGEPKKNIISFSLYGDHPRYTEGALINAKAARKIYPGWRCRFYCETKSVPTNILDELKALGAEVRPMPGQKTLFEGLFWRFDVLDDPTVSRFLIRDADSVINSRESAAVKEWLGSDKHFHIMRDNFSHASLIFAGMWGGVSGVLKGWREKTQPYLEDDLKGDHCDQRFLARELWPYVKRSVMIHDSWFKNFGARPFPKGSKLPGGRHIGDNDYWYREKGYPSVFQD